MKVGSDESKILKGCPNRNPVGRGKIIKNNEEE